MRKKDGKVTASNVEICASLNKESEITSRTLSQTTDVCKTDYTGKDIEASTKTPNINTMTSKDDKLEKAVTEFKGKCWKRIAELFPDQSDVQCLHRWRKNLNLEHFEGSWKQEEDDKINELVEEYGPFNWSFISMYLSGRDGKQCRDRWHNQLNPDIRKDNWTLEEDLALINGQQLYGKKWTDIAKIIPGRSYTAIKNRWYRHLNKNLDFYLANGYLPPVVTNNAVHNNSATDAVRTASSVTSISISQKKIESKLKLAACMFPHTPSILRKRKTDVQIPNFLERTNEKIWRK